MTEKLQQWNSMHADEAAQAVLPCCGSTAWAVGLASCRPIADEAELLNASDRVWQGLREQDWDEAFRSHPRIGQSEPAGSASAPSLTWSKGEQATASDLADRVIREELLRGNAMYEARFGRIYIVCATGKTAREMLDILQQRLQNNAVTELMEAAEQQRQITHLRLRKWLRGE